MKQLFNQMTNRAILRFNAHSKNISRLFALFFLPLLLLNSSPTTAFAQSNGLSFDGSNDYGNIPTTAPNGTGLDIPQNGSYTLEAWVYPEATNGIRGVLVKQIDYGIFIHDGKLAVFNWNNNSNPQVFIDGSTTITTNAWHHLAVTFNNGTTKLYLDGMLETTGTTTLAAATNHDIALGNGSVDVPQQHFQGIIDEVRIWNSERSLAQLVEKKNCEFTAPFPADLLAYYKLNQTSGATVTASTGSNATLNNFALTGGTSNWVTGNTAILSSCSVMSAELLGFSAQKDLSANKNVLLSWETGVEKGRNEFEIQRSTNGRIFKTIGTIAAKGTPQTYQFLDEQALISTAYYRLLVKDLDGEKYFSKVAAVAGNDKSKVKIYPSVTDGLLTIEGAKTLEIVNSLGQIVVNKGSERLQGFLSLPLHHLPNGFYVVRGVDTEGGSFSQKIIKQ